MHVQKDEDGSVIKRFGRMTGVSGEGIESRRSGWMEVSQRGAGDTSQIKTPARVSHLLSCY